MRTDLIRVEPVVVDPGKTVQVTFPAQTERGVAWVLEEQVDDAWQLRFFLTATASGYDNEATPNWWSIDDDDEGKGWDAIGVSGPGPDTLVIPETATPGSYRLCTANAVDNFCAPLLLYLPRAG